jgi:hypothetical protein
MTKSNQKKLALIHFVFALTISTCAHAQNQPAAQPQKSNITFPSGASAKKVDEFLSTLRPPGEDLDFSGILALYHSPAYTHAQTLLTTFPFAFSCIHQYGRVPKVIKQRNRQPRIIP